MLLPGRTVHAVLALTLLTTVTAACSKKKEAPAPAGSSSGAPAASSAPGAASQVAPAETGFLPEAASATGLENGVAVTSNPQGGSAATSRVPNLDIPCGRSTPADTVRTVRTFETLFVAEKPGVHEFALMTDDDSVFSVGGKEVGRSETLREGRVKVPFSKAGVYRLSLELTNNMGPYCADIKYLEPGAEMFAPLPPARLFVPR